MLMRKFSRRCAPAIAALMLLPAIDAPAQGRPQPKRGAPKIQLKADCKLVIDELAGRYDVDSRRVYLDFTVRNVGTTTCYGVDSTYVSFSWIVKTWYRKSLPGGGKTDLAPLAYDDQVDHYPAQGKAFGNIAPNGVKTLSITPAAGYSISAEYEFLQADIYVANMIVYYENNGVVGNSPFVSKGILVKP